VRRIIVIVAVSLAALALLVGCASSEEEGGADSGSQPFYEGKTIQLIVSTNPGGGYDTYGRMVAQFMEKELPGSKIIVRNVPGAGHIIGLNQVYASKPDGLTIGAFSRALPLGQVAGLEGIEFDVSKLSWLGSTSSIQYLLYMSTESGLTSLEDIKNSNEAIRISTGGVGAQNHVVALLFADMFGLDNIELVPGFQSADVENAMKRGEIDGEFSSWDSVLDFIGQGDGVPVLFIADSVPEGYEDVPTIQEEVTEERWQPVVNTLLSVNVLGRPFAGPPGIPEERLTVLRDAFENAVTSDEFMQMGERLERPVNYVGHERAEELVQGLLELPDETVQKIRTAYGIE